MKRDEITRLEDTSHAKKRNEVVRNASLTVELNAVIIGQTPEKRGYLYARRRDANS